MGTAGGGSWRRGKLGARVCRRRRRCEPSWEARAEDAGRGDALGVSEGRFLQEQDQDRGVLENKSPG